MTNEIMIAGFGGQGVMAIGKTLAEAGMKEGTDVSCGFPEDVQEFRLHGGEGFVNFLLGNLQRGQLRLIEPGGVLEEGFVPAGTDIRNDGGDGGFHIGGNIFTGEDFLVGNIAVFVNLNHGFPPALSGKIGCSPSGFS